MSKISTVDITEELRRSYLNYAMSVIVSRALPDVRDGLKPVHRRILYAMRELGLYPDRAHRKCARIVGEVLGKYHPHGDQAVYESMVRMAQEFSYRYPLVDGQGNFGSLDGDPPAAMRYTEARLSTLAMEMLKDIERETVDFVPNFDDTLREPCVLPSAFPNLLVNGSSGIAVGMATSIPPHNLKEVVDAILLVLEKPDVDVERIMNVLKGPDFPTGGILYGKEKIKQIYKEGKGVLTLRAKAEIQLGREGAHILVTQIPYQVNKSLLVQSIATLVKTKKVEGITDLRDESDKTGIRIVIELRRGEEPQVILNQLYKHTQMQVSVGVILLALVDGAPCILNIKELITHYINHRVQVIRKRASYQLQKAKEKALVLEGIKKCIKNLDLLVKNIRESKDKEEAKERLIKTFLLTSHQADSILSMPLYRLTRLEQKKVEEDYLQIIKEIQYLESLLISPEQVQRILKDELLQTKERHGDERRTQILEGGERIEEMDLVVDEPTLITLSCNGYVKRQDLSLYRRQRRGGKGVVATQIREEDAVRTLFVTTAHKKLLFITERGRAFSLEAFRVPEGQRSARGKPITKMLDVGQERVCCIVQMEEGALFIATEKGIVKKISSEHLKKMRRHGISCMKVDKNDRVQSAVFVNDEDVLLLATKRGRLLCIRSNDVRCMGRGARGVRGIRLLEEDRLLMVKRGEGEWLLTITEKGFGKITPLHSFPIQRRGARGVLCAKLSATSGNLVAALSVGKEEEVMLITEGGFSVRLKVANTPCAGRYARGARLMQTRTLDKVVACARILKDYLE